MLVAITKIVGATNKQPEIDRRMILHQYNSPSIGETYFVYGGGISWWVGEVKELTETGFITTGNIEIKIEILAQ